MQCVHVVGPAPVPMRTHLSLETDLPGYRGPVTPSPCGNYGVPFLPQTNANPCTCCNSLLKVRSAAGQLMFPLVKLRKLWLSYRAQFCRCFLQKRHEPAFLPSLPDNYERGMSHTFPYSLASTASEHLSVSLPVFANGAQMA